jgi:glycosyltransferase involved in cell wall biosynthesis
MKIAIYHNLLSGGAKRALYEFTRRLCSRHQIDVFTLSSSNHEFADIRPFVHQHKIYPFESGRLFQSPLGRLNQAVRIQDLRRIEALSRQIARDIDSGGYDLVFAQPCQIENSPSILHFLQKTPSIFFCQEPLRMLYEEMPARPYDRKESFTRRFFNRLDPLPGLYRQSLKKRDARNLRAANRVLVNSEFIRQSAQRIYQVNTRVNPLGVDSSLFRKIETPKEPFLFSVGSLTPLKGFDFLIRAIAHIPAEERLPLRLASNFQNPPERDYLHHLAASLGVQLEMMDNIRDELLVKLYNQALLTVYAPIREPFGFVAIESMACGTPVVAVKEGGVAETVIDGQVGMLSERNEEAFARAIQQMIQHPDLLEAYGKNAQAYVRAKWTWDHTIQTLEAYFKELIGPVRENQ